MNISHTRSKADEDGATALLRTQHREIDQLLSSLLRVPSARDKARLLDEVGDLIAVHLAVEERVFYPGLGASADHAASEVDQELKRLATDLLDTDPAARSFDAAVAFLRERFRAHARAEERGFSSLRQRLPRVHMRRLAYDMRVLEFQLRTDAELRDCVLGPSNRTAHA